MLNKNPRNIGYPGVLNVSGYVFSKKYQEEKFPSIKPSPILI
jgi:hypothetical protein